MTGTHRQQRLRTAALVLCALCAGCGGSAINPAAISQPIDGLLAAATAGANVYVADPRTQAITVYAAGGKPDQSPLATIGGPDTDIISPDGVAVDRADRVYVANAYYPGSITVFGANPRGRIRTPPIAIIAGGSTGIDTPVGVAVDGAGRIYVANNAGYFASVTVYAPNPRGNVTGPPLATISGSNANVHYPLSLALGPHGEIVVVNNYGHGYVTIYPPNPRGNVDEKPRETIGGGSTGLNGPTAGAIDADGKAYVTSANPSKGYLGYVTVYPPHRGDFTGSPSAVIGGVRSGVQFPDGIALDQNGAIYVTNEYANTVTVYAPNPTGNVTGPPIASIHGRATELARPLGITLH